MVITGVSRENVHKLMELVDEFMLNDACYINVCRILDDYRLTNLWGLEFQEVKVSCFVAITRICFVSLLSVELLYSYHDCTVNV